MGHVDDFLCHGPRDELASLLASLRSEYEVSGSMVGPQEDEVQEVKFLGRTIRYTPAVYEWEGDQKHVATLLERLGFEKGRGVPTPGVKKDEVEEASREPLGPKEAKDYRGQVALVNFVSQDRPDVSFASKDVSKYMSSPAACDQAPLKRIGRYLSLYPRCVYLYQWQDPVSTAEVFSDSDWAGTKGPERAPAGER